MSFVFFPTKPEHGFIPGRVVFWSSGIASTACAIFLVWAGIQLQIPHSHLWRPAVAPFMLWAIISWIFNPKGFGKLSPAIQWVVFLGLAAAAILS